MAEFVISNHLVVYSPDKGVDIDCQTVEFDDVRYHIQVMFFFGPQRIT